MTVVRNKKKLASFVPLGRRANIDALMVAFCFCLTRLGASAASNDLASSMRMLTIAYPGQFGGV